MIRIARSFLSGAAGNVGVIFALAAMPLLLVTGAAVDYSRASDLHTRLQSAIDSTVLGLCQADATISTPNLTTRATASLNGIMPGQTVSVVDLQVTNSPRTVTLQATANYPTIFMKLAHADSLTVEAGARCSANETYFEIALVLDTTGSMAYAASGTQTKMEAAKEAAKNFVDYMYTTGALPGHIKMSLVPFAASVAVNPATYRSASWLDLGAASNLHWQYVTNRSGQNMTNRFTIFNKLKAVNSDWDWKGCLESLPYPQNTRDAGVSASDPQSYFLPLFAPDEVGNTKTCSFYGYQYACQDATSGNSYMDDGTSTTGSCQNDASTTLRFGQACKYNNPKNIRTGEGGPNWQCTSRALSRLGTSRTTLKSEITALQPSGSTNVHEGLMWGWRTISPTSVFSSDAAAYGTKNTKKVLVLMTDGTNQWLANSNVAGKSNYSAYGYFKNVDGSAANSRLPTGNQNLAASDDARDAIDALTLEGCTNAKAKNVTIYTVGFSTTGDPIDAKGLALLSSCASGSEYAFVANDAAGLIDAFARIGSGIGQLRLTN